MHVPLPRVMRHWKGGNETNLLKCVTPSCLFNFPCLPRCDIHNISFAKPNIARLPFHTASLWTTIPSTQQSYSSILRHETHMSTRLSCTHSTSHDLSVTRNQARYLSKWLIQFLRLNICFHNLYCSPATNVENIALQLSYSRRYDRAFSNQCSRTNACCDNGKIKQAPPRSRESCFHCPRTRINEVAVQTMPHSKRASCGQMKKRTINSDSSVSSLHPAARAIESSEASFPLRSCARRRERSRGSLRRSRLLGRCLEKCLVSGRSYSLPATCTLEVKIITARQ